MVFAAVALRRTPVSVTFEGDNEFRLQPPLRRRNGANRGASHAVVAHRPRVIDAPSLEQHMPIAADVQSVGPPIGSQAVPMFFRTGRISWAVIPAGFECDIAPARQRQRRSLIGRCAAQTAEMMQIVFRRVRDRAVLPGPDSAARHAHARSAG